MDSHLDQAQDQIHGYLDEQEQRAKAWAESPLRQSRLLIAGVVVALLLTSYVAGCIHGEREAAAAPSAAVEATR